METKEIFKVVRKRYKWFLFSAAVAFSLGCYICFIVMDKSVASVSILIPTTQVKLNELGASDAERFAFGQQMNINSMRLLDLIYSDEMIRHIEEKFKLYDHYYIDKNQPYAWNRLVEKFQDNLAFTRDSEEKARVTFTDKDEVYAADIANEVVLKLIALNRDYIISMIRQRTVLYSNIINGINSEIDGKINRMEAVLSDFKAQSNVSERNFDKLNLNIEGATKDLVALTSELVKTKQYYSWSEFAIEKNFQNNLIVLNSAIPDKRGFQYVEVIAAGIVSAFSMAVIFCLFIYAYHYTRNQFLTVFNNG